MSSTAAATRKPLRRRGLLVLLGVVVLAGVFAGVNAAVVGLLLAALYTPVATSALTSPGAGALALLGWALLALARAPVLAVVLLLPALGQAFL